jgi:CheY-like chemotaxis protein
MVLKPADATPVSFRTVACRRPSPRRGGPHGRRILLAIGDDWLEAWRSGLMAAGHHVVSVPDPEAALDALAEQPFDVFLLDLALPEALETAKLYRFLALGGEAVPVVGLTAGEPEGGERQGEARQGEALCGCLPRERGSAGLGPMFPSMFPGQFRAEPDQDSAAQVVDFAAYREARARPS